MPEHTVSYNRPGKGGDTEIADDRNLQTAYLVVIDMDEVPHVNMLEAAQSLHLRLLSISRTP